jgi:hypothetical protein
MDSRLKLTRCLSAALGKENDCEGFDTVEWLTAQRAIMASTTRF